MVTVMLQIGTGMCSALKQIQGTRNAGKMQRDPETRRAKMRRGGENQIAALPPWAGRRDGRHVGQLVRPRRALQAPLACAAPTALCVRGFRFPSPYGLG